MYFSIQGNTINSDAIAYICAEEGDNEIKGIFMVTLYMNDFAPLYCFYDTKEERDTVFAKLNNLLDVQPLEVHLKVDAQETLDLL